MRVLRSKTFWVGVVVGAVAGPVVIGKVAPGVKAKLPAQ